MEFVYILKATRGAMLSDGPTEAEMPALALHGEYLAGLADDGVLELAGRTQNEDPSAFGIVIFRAPDPTAAREIMEADPAVRGGVMTAMLFPYRVAFRGGLGGATERADDGVGSDREG